MPFAVRTVGRRGRTCLTYACTRSAHLPTPTTKSNHQRGYRRRKRIMSSVAAKRAAAIISPVLVARDNTSPVLVTTARVELEVAERSDRTIRIGMAQSRRKTVVSR